jgi:hypothetical protein
MNGGGMIPRKVKLMLGDYNVCRKYTKNNELLLLTTWLVGMKINEQYIYDRLHPASCINIAANVQQIIITMNNM